MKIECMFCVHSIECWMRLPVSHISEQLAKTKQKTVAISTLVSIHMLRATNGVFSIWPQGISVSIWESSEALEFHVVINELTAKVWPSLSARTSWP